MPVWDSLDGSVPKRGDLVQTNTGDKRERTWFVLRVRRIRGRESRFSVWIARWWELEPDFRLKLYESAERNGGQKLFDFKRYPVKKKSKPKFDF